MSKKRLGRGLGALITESETDSGQIKEILLTDIVSNPDQPRQDFDEEKLKELADSIREHGLLQPILVRPEGNGYQIIAGERRFRASKLAGLDRIQCIVRDCTEQEMTEKALIENIQRDDLSPVEEGLAYAKLIEDYGLTQEQVAKRVGKGRATIANLLRIIQMPQEILDLLNKGHISLGHAKVILSVEDPDDQIKLAERVYAEALSVRELENLIIEIKQNASITKKTKQKKNNKYNEFTEIEEKLRNIFQTKVAIKGNETKGKIEIEYYSKQELSRLLEKMNIQL
ncbi:MAG: ParB/RepB/Spo0J family partition protein [Peptococcaceae bacterium]|nr:ParB/RepB/Spo0J family partition protein [Peptococcaceae bacterium]